MDSPPRSATHPSLSPPPQLPSLFNPSEEPHTLKPPKSEEPHTLKPPKSEELSQDQENSEPSEQDSRTPGMNSDKDPNFGVELHLVSPPSLFRLPSFSTRKKGKPKLKKQQLLEKKYQTLSENIRPVPFSPSKLLYFAKHEKLLRRLGLWDFVQIEFGKTVNTDLIAQLVSTYESKARCSYVNGYRIKVSRPDLARALKLPTRRDRVSEVFDGVDVDLDMSEEAIGFIEDFVSNWVLLHEDTWMMPLEVLNWMTVIKDGHPEKVDWAGLFWFMVEKELTKGEQLVDCYYASHLQYLIMQRLEREVAKVDLEREEKTVVLASESNKVDLDGEEKAVDLAGEPGKVDLDGEEKAVVLAGEPHKVDLDGEEKAVVLAGEPDKVDLGGEQKSVVLAGEPDQVYLDGEEKEVVVGVPNENCLQLDCTNEVEKEDFDVGVESKRVDLNGEENKGDVAEGSMGVYPISDVQKEEAGVPKSLNIELRLGDHTGAEEEIVEEEENVHDAEMMDLREGNEHVADDNPGNWQLDAENTVSEHTLQRCNMELGNELYNYGGIKEEVEDIEEEDEEEEEAEDTFDILENHDTLLEDGLTGNFLQTMQENKLEYSSHLQLHGQPDITHIASRNDMQQTDSAGPSFYGNGSKRAMEHMSENTQNYMNKRLRIDGPWNSESLNFGMCMDGVQQFITRATMMYEAKEQSLEQSNMHHQILLNEVQKRDGVIEHLHKSQCEVNQVMQKKDEEIYRLERELYVMGNLLDGYRDSLKKTQKAFAEYKQLFPQPEESIYKDAGPGGLMLTTEEIERRRLKQQEDYRTNCLMLEHRAKEAEEGYACQFTAFIEKVQELDNRLVGLEDEMMKLKKLSYNRQCMEAEQLISRKPDDFEGTKSGQPVSKETIMHEQPAKVEIDMVDNCKGTKNEEPVSREATVLEHPSEIDMADNCEATENEVSREATVLEQPASNEINMTGNCEGTQNEEPVLTEATVLEQADFSNIDEGTKNEGNQGTETEQN